MRRGPKGYERSDERLKEDISERLYATEHIDSSEVTIQVSSGVVTLEGSVHDRHSKFMIEDMVDSVPGVKEVDNKLRISRGEDSHEHGSQGGSSTSMPGRSSSSSGSSSSGKR